MTRIKKHKLYFDMCIINQGWSTIPFTVPPFGDAEINKYYIRRPHWGTSVVRVFLLPPKVSLNEKQRARRDPYFIDFKLFSMFWGLIYPKDWVDTNRSLINRIGAPAPYGLNV